MAGSIKIAHLVLAHKDPVQLSLLIRRLVDENMHCFIHIDKKSNIDDFFKLIPETQYVKFIRDRVDIQWGGFGTIQATLNGFSEILRNDVKYDYLHVMSGQDFPIKSNAYILQFIEENYGKQFFDFIHHSWPSDIHTRYSKLHFINWKLPGKYKFSNAVSAIRGPRRFYFKGKVYGSSNWFMITSNCADYLLKRIYGDTKLVRYFKTVWGADEFIFINVLMNSSYASSINEEGIHFMRWEPGSAHASILKFDDLELLLTSRKLFARKFDMAVSASLLEQLNEHIS